MSAKVVCVKGMFLFVLVGLTRCDSCNHDLIKINLKYHYLIVRHAECVQCLHGSHQIVALVCRVAHNHALMTVDVVSRG